MYIAPNTTIKILHGVPLDPTYDHTIYFASESAQSTYFSGKAKYVLTAQSYQRVQRGYMRVEIQAESLYDCNYLMFQNTSFGTKWFYAFIKSVEYINNAVSQIEFEIDVMQTWFFDYTLDACFVEREHTVTDNLYENIVEENLNLGDEAVCISTETFDMNEMEICILAKRENSWGVGQSKVVNGIYTPLLIIAGFEPSDFAYVDNLIFTSMGLKEDDIVVIYQYPAKCGNGVDAQHVPNDPPTTAKSYTKTITANTTQIQGSTTGWKNKKLFSYPYNYLLVSNNNGQTAIYRWEDWNTNISRGLFRIVGVMATTPAIMCYPQNYKGIGDPYDEGLVFSNFPQCAWPGDTFKAWWAQNKASFVTSGISSVLGSVLAGAGALTAATGNPVIGVAGAVVSGASAIASHVARTEDLKETPPQTHGQTQTDSLKAGMGRMQFNFYNMTIKEQYARIIDDYFSRYGYACKRTKVPNRNARPYWTYTKTQACTITPNVDQYGHGGLPADDAVAICNIYNNGITFWKNGDNIGNYTLDNSPS